MGISLLLSLVVFLTMIVKKFLPPTGLAFPLIAKFLVFTFVTNLMSLAVNVFICNVSYREETSVMSKFTKWAFLSVLPKWLRIQRPTTPPLQQPMRVPVITPQTVTECGYNHSNCIYKRTYPNTLVRCEKGLLPPEWFCPNRAIFSLHQLAKASQNEFNSNKVMRCSFVRTPSYTNYLTLSFSREARNGNSWL